MDEYSFSSTEKAANQILRTLDTTGEGTIADRISLQLKLEGKGQELIALLEQINTRIGEILDFLETGTKAHESGEAYYDLKDQRDREFNKTHELNPEMDLQVERAWRNFRNATSAWEAYYEKCQELGTTSLEDEIDRLHDQQREVLLKLGVIIT